MAVNLITFYFIQFFFLFPLPLPFKDPLCDRKVNKVENEKKKNKKLNEIFPFGWKRAVWIGI